MALETEYNIPQYSSKCLQIAVMQKNAVLCVARLTVRKLRLLNSAWPYHCSSLFCLNMLSISSWHFF